MQKFGEIQLFFCRGFNSLKVLLIEILLVFLDKL